MNCTEVRLHLPDLLYGDLKKDEAAVVEEHLRGCPNCRAAYAALRPLPALLDAVPAPAVRIDLPRLYQQVAESQERRLRRWRRAAVVALASAAAAVLLIALLRLEVRLEPHQVVVRWGSLPEAPGPAPVVVPPPADEPRVEVVGPMRSEVEMEDRLRIVTELAQLLASEMDSRDRRQRQEVQRLRIRLQELQQQMVQWRTATDRNLTAFYLGRLMTSWCPLSVATHVALTLEPQVQ